jgi:hypothetical protein
MAPAKATSNATARLILLRRNVIAVSKAAVPKMILSIGKSPRDDEPKMPTA